MLLLDPLHFYMLQYVMKINIFFSLYLGKGWNNATIPRILRTVWIQFEISLFITFFAAEIFLHRLNIYCRATMQWKKLFPGGRLSDRRGIGAGVSGHCVSILHLSSNKRQEFTIAMSWRRFSTIPDRRASRTGSRLDFGISEWMI